MTGKDHGFVLVNVIDAQHGSEEANLSPRIMFSRKPPSIEVNSSYDAEPPDVKAKIQKWLCPTEFSSEVRHFRVIPASWGHILGARLRSLPHKLPTLNNH